MNRQSSSARGRQAKRPSIEIAAAVALNSARRTLAFFEGLETRTLFAGGVSPTTGAVDKLDLEHNAAATYIAPSTYLFKRNSYLTGANNGQPLDIALNYVKANAGAFDLSAADIGSPVVTSQYTDSDSGMTHIYLRQQLNGLEIGNADMNVNVTHDGRVLSVGSTFVAGVAALQGTLMAPGIGAISALGKAASNLGLTLTNAAHLKTEPFGTAQTQTLTAGDISIDDVPAHLRYVAVAGGGVELAWQFVLNVPGGQHWFDTSVSAATGKLRFTADWTDNDSFGESTSTSTGSTKPSKTTSPTSTASSTPSTVSVTRAKELQAASYNAAYNVYAFPKMSPDSGPRTIVTNPWDLAASPFGWHDTNGDAARETSDTSGNNVIAQEDANNNNGTGTRPIGVDVAGTLTFDNPVDLSQAPSAYQLAATTNLFYWNNLIHDIHFKYGFTEPAGNFQTKNYTNTGIGNDQVNADAQDGGGLNNANFSTPVDGQSGRMQMYLWANTSPQRDGDFDAGVIIHEYGHGVSTRLTGGPANSSSLNNTQSGGMGEGWGDWWAAMFQQTSTTNVNTDTIGEGTYIAGQTAIGPGLRRWPYSFDKNADPKTWDLFNSESEVHRTGEIWTTTLYDMAVLLEKKYGFNPNISAGYTIPQGNGNLLALKLVMDALKLQPSNPSFTQARDAILQADTALTGGLNQREIWTAFARRGLGFSAVDTGSTALSITTAYDIPANAGSPTVNQSTPFGNTKLTTLSSFTFNFSEPMVPGTFAAGDITSFTGPGAVNLGSQVTTFVWSNSNKTLTVNFNQQSANGTYSMRIGPAIQAADNGANMDQDLNGTAGQANDAYTATAVLDTSPGPDAGGYEATTQAMSFTSINGTGTSILDGQDDTAGTIPLGGNTFRYYGQNYTSIGVSENGTLVPGATSTTFLNGNLEIGANPMIAVLWDDLATDGTTGTTGDRVVYQIVGNQLIVEWSNMHARGDFTSTFTNASNTETFQAVLDLNTGTTPGALVFNYPDLDLGANRFSNGKSATVGLKGPGNNGLGYASQNRLLLSEDAATDNWLNSGVSVRIGQSLTSNNVSGLTFIDRNSDGVQNGGEPALPGVRVFDDANANNAFDVGETNVISDASGNYSLGSLTAGNHSIRGELATYVATNPTAGNVNLVGGTANVALGFFPTVFFGTSASDTFTLGLGAGGTSYAINAVGIAYSAPVSLLATSSLTFNGGAGNDTLTVDAANGVPIPVGVTFDGSTQTTSDTLVVNGSTGADNVAFNLANVTIGGKTITKTSVEAITFDGKLGGDTVAVNAGPVVNMPASQRFASLNIAAAAAAAMNVNGNRLLVVTNLLTISGKLDLNDNDMVVKAAAAPFATVAGEIASAYNFGGWDGLGITSTSALNGPGNTSLGSLSGDDYVNNTGATNYGGEPIVSGDSVVKYTYFGDVDFNGSIDASDYNLIDFGFTSHLSGWANGDADYSGGVDASDYNVIDFAFSTQSGVL